MGALQGWLAALGAFLLVPVTWWGVRRGRPPRRELAYTIVANQDVITRSQYSRQWSQLDVRFDDLSLQDPRTTVIRIENTGRVEARAADFEEPLSVHTQERDTIIAAKISLYATNLIEKTGTELEGALTDDRKTVRAPAVLMNPGDAIEFQLLIEGVDAAVAPNGRVAGFVLRPAVERRTANQRVQTLLRWDLPVLVIAAASGLYVYALVHIGSGDDNKSVMSPLYGDSQTVATKKISDSYLFLSQVFAIPSGLAKGQVVYQSILPGTEINGGESVDIGVSTGKAP
jgi:hypothetical protein